MLLLVDFIKLKIQMRLVMKHMKLIRLAGLVKHNEGDLTFLLKDLATHYDRNSLANKKLFEGESAYILQ